MFLLDIKHKTEGWGCSVKINIMSCELAFDVGKASEFDYCVAHAESSGTKGFWHIDVFWTYPA